MPALAAQSKACSNGPVESFTSIGHRRFRTATHSSERECSKKFVQQGRSSFAAWSVLSVREHGKRERTPLAAFFNISLISEMSDCSLPRLYLLTDRHNTSQRPLASVISQAIEAGVRLIQIREKDLDTRQTIELIRDIKPLIKQYHGKVLLNDRIDLALALDADGVHLRSDSLPLPLARRLLGHEKLIGISAHSVEDVRKAESDGADFIVLGPIFETPSKRMYGPPLGLHTLEAACRTSRLPIFAIGGLNPTHVTSVLASGAYGVAVISAILQAPSIVQSTNEFLSQLP